MLYCIALHLIALHCIALRCIALHCVALCCIVLRCVVLCCVMLCYVISARNVLLEKRVKYNKWDYAGKLETAVSEERFSLEEVVMD